MHTTQYESHYIPPSSHDPFFSLTLNAVELSLFCDDGIVEEVFSGNDGDETLPNDFEISEDTWLALQVDQNSDDSGLRVRDISAPLAEAGISILFLSTYISDVSLTIHCIAVRTSLMILPAASSSW
jgi:hypothetical protein